MAVGADKALRSSSPAPLRPPRSAPMSSPGAYGPRPLGMSDDAVQRAVNNQLVAGYGARQVALSDSTRRGVSRGKWHEHNAKMAQEAADAQAEAAAAQTQMGAAAANAAAQQQYESTMRNEELANVGLLEGLRSAQASERLAKAADRQQLYQAYRRGQFGLDQISPDYSSLLRGLLG